MRFLFCGSTKGNSGPSNVNKGIVSNLNENFLIIKSQNKCFRLLELLCKVAICDVVVLSGVSKFGQIACALAKATRKKSVYIMHGCAEYEVKLNQQKNMGKGLRYEAYIWENADLLLPVSEKFMLWFGERYPQYLGKLSYLHNGIDVKHLENLNAMPKKPGSIVVTGADRGVKNNLAVVNAVENMNGIAELSVCGLVYHSVPTGFNFSHYTGILPREQFIQKLAQSELFVLNSIFEPFSLAAIEALMCGCSILVSEVAGVTDLLTLEETDVIHNPMDVEEIRGKIEYLLENPNNERILSTLDLAEYSCPRQVEKLERICRKLAEE